MSKHPKEDSTSAGGQQTCPRKSGHDQECDLDSVEIELVHPEDGAISVKKKSGSKDKVKWPAFKEAYSGDYDLVLEAVANHEKAREKTKPSKLSVKTSYIGKCPNSDPHPYITCSIGNPDEYDLSAAYLTSDKVTFNNPDLLSKTIKADVEDKWGSQGISALRTFWDLVFNSNHKDYVIDVDSCGNRKAGEPFRSASALVRLYRDDTFAMKFDLPPFKSRSVTKNATKSENATYEKVETANLLDGIKETTETGKAKNVEKADGNPGSFIQMNGKTVVDLDWITTLSEVVDKIFETVTNISQTVPQVGFKVVTEVSFFQGSLALTWGNENTKKQSSAVQKWVTPYYEIDASLTIVAYKFDISFGLEIGTADGWFGNVFHLVAKVGFTAEASAKYSEKNKRLLIDPGDPVQTNTSEAVGAITAYAKGAATIMGDTVEASAELQGEVSIKIETSISIAEGYSTTGSYTIKPIKFVAYLHSSCDLVRKRGPYEHIFYEGVKDEELFKF